MVRRRLAENNPVTRILAEIREQGYTGSANLLVRYINQGRADPERVAPSPRRLVSWLMSRPTNLPLPYSNGPAEGVNTKVKMLKRQTYGRASFSLLRKRILLNQ